MSRLLNLTLIAVACTGWLRTFAVLADSAGRRYTIDSTQTRVSFEVRVFGIIHQRGWFEAITGSVILDSEAGTGQLDIVIDARSIRAHSGALERLIRGISFLNVDVYPQLAYDARRIVFSAGRPALVDGELTMHGVTRPIPLRVTAYTCTSGDVRQECVMDAEATLRRSDFGMTGYKSLAADEMLLNVRAAAKPNKNRTPDSHERQPVRSSTRTTIR